MTARALPFAPIFPFSAVAPGGLISMAANALGSLLKGRARGSAAAVVQQAAEPSGPPRNPADIERFRRLLLPCQDDAYAFALHLCRDPSTAEDLAQEAYLKAYRGFSSYRGGDPKAWLLAIVRTCFLDWARGRKAWAAMVDPDAADQAEAAPADDPTVEDRMVREAGVGELRQAIDALPEPFKQTLVLRELQEMNYRQIAEITGAPIGTVMSRLARARAILIAALRPAKGATA
jgi:RNA polymerase sigma factor (sigma-70 family)